MHQVLGGYEAQHYNLESLNSDVCLQRTSLTMFLLEKDAVLKCKHRFTVDFSIMSTLCMNINVCEFVCLPECSFLVLVVK